MQYTKELINLVELCHVPEEELTSTILDATADMSVSINLAYWLKEFERAISRENPRTEYEQLLADAERFTDEAEVFQCEFGTMRNEPVLTMWARTQDRRMASIVSDIFMELANQVEVGINN